MRPFALLLVLALGCGERRASLKVAAAGATMFGLGVALTRSDAEEVPPGYPAVLATLIVGGGATAILAGLDAIFLYNAWPAERPRPIARDDRRSAARERAWSVTQAAALAARRDDCARVIAADAEVAALDAELHAVVFRRDAAIARCLAQGRL